MGDIIMAQIIMQPSIRLFCHVEGFVCFPPKQAPEMAGNGITRWLMLNEPNKKGDSLIFAEITYEHMGTFRPLFTSIFL